MMKDKPSMNISDVIKSNLYYIVHQKELNVQSRERVPHHMSFQTLVQNDNALRQLLVKLDHYGTCSEVA